MYFSIGLTDHLLIIKHIVSVMIRVLGLRGQLCIHQSEVLEKQHELSLVAVGSFNHYATAYEAFGLSMSNTRINQSFQG